MYHDKDMTCQNTKSISYENNNSQYEFPYFIQDINNLKYLICNNPYLMNNQVRIIWIFIILIKLEI